MGAHSWFNLPVPVSGKPLRNFLWLAVERVLRIAVAAGVLAVVARYLQPAGFGQLGFAISFQGLFVPLATFGLEGLLVNELVRRPNQSGELLGTAAVLRLMAGIASMVLCLGLALAIPAYRSSVWFILPLSLSFLWQCTEVTDIWFQRHLQSRRTAIVRFTVVLIGALIKVALVWGQAAPVWFAWAVMGDVLMFELGLLLAYARLPGKAGTWKFDTTLAQDLARRAWPLALAGLLLALQLRIDQFVVKASLPEAEAGAYFAAVRLVELPLFLTVAMAVSVFPGLAASHGRGEAEFSRHAQCLFDLLNGFTWVAALGLTLLGPWIVKLLFGAAYAGTLPSLIVLAWGLVPWAGSFARQQCILTAHPTWLQMTAAVIGIAVQIPLALCLVPYLGGPGAALASMVANLASGWLTSFVLPGLRPCGIWQARAFLIPISPQRWRAALALLT